MTMDFSFKKQSNIEVHKSHPRILKGVFGKQESDQPPRALFVKTNVNLTSEGFGLSLFQLLEDKSMRR